LRQELAAYGIHRDGALLWVWKIPWIWALPEVFALFAVATVCC
jgi:hypothetical protein